MAMMDRISEETVEYIFRVQVMPQPKFRTKPVLSSIPGTQKLQSVKQSQTQQQNHSDSPSIPGKIGRNDPCPCGSGKKYKKCCGR